MAAIENVHDLEVFEQVVGTGSFTQAARALKMSQPAVSLAVKRLERQLGAELFQRQPFGPNAISLTDAGKILVSHVGIALKEIDGAAQEIESLEKRHAVRLSLPPIIMSHYFKHRMTKLTEALHGHKVIMCSWGSARTLEEIKRHNIDVGVVAYSGDSLDIPHVKAIKVGTFPFCLAISPGSDILASYDAIDVADFGVLPSYPFVSFTNDFMQHNMLVELSENYGKDPHIIAETDQISELKSFISSGLGIGFVTSLFINTKEDGISSIPIVGDDAPSFNIFIFEDKSRPFHSKDSYIGSILDVLSDSLK
jgi:DNA-binding transcriptional LysR family regulator